METKNKLFAIAIFAFVACCTTSGSNHSVSIVGKEISGLWFYVGEGSSYREVFFTDSCLWSYDEGAGPRFYRIKLTSGNSIEIYDNGELLSESKISKIDNNEMIFANNLDTTKFARVKSLLLREDEMGKLLTGDLETIQMFIDRFRSRENEWRDKR